MFQPLSRTKRAWSICIVLAAVLTACLVWQTRPINQSVRLTDDGREPAAGAFEVNNEPVDTLPHKEELAGEQARTYLEQTNEGRSLMQAVTAERFGLKLEERDPISGENGAGYLAMSHDQNLNAWFDNEGVTVRPTATELSWKLGFRLKAYGYGQDLIEAPPIVSREVKGSRIEYVHAADFGKQIPDLGLMKSNISLNPQSAIRTPQLVEWYENRAEGIEQGFTISERPTRSGEVAATEPLRVSLGITGELRARVDEAGQRIEFVDARGKHALSYSKLTAVDAENKELSARMEASTDGREIALVIGDQNAVYPIVIDPIVATQEQKLEGTQVDSRFGFAVAIDGDRAVVGAWREDVVGFFDVGIVYTFRRLANTWTLLSRNNGFNTPNGACGWSVAISGNRVVFGCPGMANQTGAAYTMLSNGSDLAELTHFQSPVATGDQLGYSVSISGNNVIVGAPFNDARGADSGLILIYELFSNGSLSRITINGYLNSQFGTSVAVDGNTIISGAPGYLSGRGFVSIMVYSPSAGQLVEINDFYANDGEAGDQFGNSVDISGNKAVVGAWGDDDGATDSGAAYVFVRAANGNWSQQQKITGNGRAGDHFSEHAAAIEGNTMVVGAYGWDSFFGNDDAGAAYIFTRSGTVWTQQTRLDGASDYHYGIAVDISGDSILVGARRADAPGIARAGATYVYRLDCTAPSYDSFPGFIVNDDPFTFSNTVCPGDRVKLGVLSTLTNWGNSPLSYQWRKDGNNIPGATSSIYNRTNMGASDAGIYDVIISNACGAEISKPLTLGVHTFSLDPAIANLGASGSDSLISVTSSGLCVYAAVSNASWIKITSNGSGVPHKNVGFHVDPNTSPSQRTGTITIGDKTFTVTQDGLNCSYAIAPTSKGFTASGGANNTFAVTATAGCGWTAQTNAPTWLTINAGATGIGNGTVNYSVAANTGAARTGTISVAGQTFTVTQEALSCSYSIAPTSKSFTSSGGANNTFTVTATAGCGWTAQSNASTWLTINAGSSGTGNGIVTYSVAANTGPARTGTISIAGQTFTVTQEALSCSYAVAPTSQGFTATGGSNAISVNAAGGCAWAAQSNSPFITINSGGSGNGSGSVNYAVAANTGSARSGTITIAGQTFTVNQAAPMWESVVLTTDQVELKTWTLQGRTYAYVKLLFPNAGYRVPNWGQPINAGSNISADALVEKFNGPSVLAVTTTAQIYDLGPLTNGNYTFTFRNSNVAVKSLAFTVSSAIPPPNPIDNAREFVRWQYRDFLNREADQAGEDFWTDNITKCSDPARRPAGQTDAQCTTRQRETTSGAFFQSPEFQYTGYYVYRMYQGALGRRPKLSEFTPDALFVGNGIIVNGQLSAAKINQNKAAFAQQFVNCIDPARYRCSEFKAIYDGLSNQQYVDRLFLNTGVNASASDRTALVNGLNAATETRATVLQKVVDGINAISEGNQQFTTTYGQTFYNNEFNRAFVQLEYFGYMKRDPDDGGYAFWLAKLNQFGGNFVNAEMVLAFISSPEYRARFGQP